MAQRDPAATQRTDWSRAEVEATVADYFAMLATELSGVPYNKTAHRRRLVTLLDGRSEQSIEFKHANISAVLLDLGFPYISGYKPRSNYQHLLYDIVSDRLASSQALPDLAAADADLPIAVPEVDDGAGFDILSFETSGHERLVEVKTTKYGRETPFFVTRNEIAVSESQAPGYHVYRLFTFRASPQLFTLTGALSATCELSPSTFVARVA